MGDVFPPIFLQFIRKRGLILSDYTKPSSYSQPVCIKFNSDSFMTPGL